MNVSIVDFQQSFSAAFKQLNYEWIDKYFEIEQSDKQMLEDPERYIVEKGGLILLALLDNEPVGTCALIKHSDDKYELAKMAVSPKAQGKQIGYQLGTQIIQRARQLSASTVFLETNSKLEPALRLYDKLGFKTTCGQPSPYARCNVQMELKL